MVWGCICITTYITSYMYCLLLHMYCTISSLFSCTIFTAYVLPTHVSIYMYLILPSYTICATCHGASISRIMYILPRFCENKVVPNIVCLSCLSVVTQRGTNDTVIMRNPALCEPSSHRLYCCDTIAILPSILPTC